MAIRITCAACDHTVQVRDTLAGKRVKCPMCRQAVVVPRAQKKRPRSGNPPASRRSSAAGTSGSRPARPETRRKPAGPDPETTDAAASDDWLLSSSGDTADSRTDFSSAEPSAPRLPPRKKSVRLKAQRTAARKGVVLQAHSATRDRDATRKAVLSSFNGKLPRRPLALHYRFGVLLAAVLAVLMPIAYLAVVAGVGYLTWQHAATNHTWMTAVRGRGAVFMAAAYITPILAGICCVLLLLKPLIAGRGTSDRRVGVNRASQPLLFEFIDRLCETVGAPKPRAVELIFDANAAAALESGVISFLRGDLRLYIGLPLVAGMTLNQFAGVLAHEFGHFSQGSAMRLQRIVRGVNEWFARAVYERDAWDEAVVAAGDDIHPLITLVMLCVQLIIGVTRMVMWVFMKCSNALTCWISKQMEYDADRSEYGLVGADVFEETTMRLHELHFAFQLYIYELMTKGGPGEIRNPIRDIAGISKTLSEEQKESVREAAMAHEKQLFDVHPSDSKRIAAARRADPTPVFSSRLPAEAVFHNFDGVCLAMMSDSD